MILYLFNKIRNLKNSLKMLVIKRVIYKNCTLIGGFHNFGIKSRVQLLENAKKENVILNDHVEMFGCIRAIGNGVVTMDEWSKIGENCTIEAVNRVSIGKDTAIAVGVVICDTNYHPINPDDRRYMRHTPHDSDERKAKHGANAPIIIGQNVMIGANATILKGVTIGDNAIIGRQSVVTKDVPANSIAVGNPAKIVKRDIHLSTKPVFINL